MQLYYLDRILLPEAGVYKKRGDVFDPQEAGSSADSITSGGFVGELSADELAFLNPAPPADPVPPVDPPSEGDQQKESVQPPVESGAGGGVVNEELLARVKTALTGAKKRLKSLSEELGVPEDQIQPLLVESNGITVNAGWFSVSVPA